MKPDPSPPPQSLRTSQGGTVLDWPVEHGLREDIARQIRAKAKKTNRRRRRAAAASGIAGLVLLFALFWGVPWMRDTSTAITNTGQRQALALPDGSHAELNAATRIRTDFRYGRRIVHLDQGEAYLSVAKDSAHPFFVETTQGVIRVTGTEFNVRLDDSSKGEVTLIEGSIELSRGSLPAVHLKPGQQFKTDETGPRTLAETDLASVLAWRKGQFAFDGLTLAEAAARIGAYHGCTISVSPEVAGLRVHGSCAIDDLPKLLETVEMVLSVHVARTGEGAYQIVAR